MKGQGPWAMAMHRAEPSPQPVPIKLEVESRVQGSEWYEGHDVDIRSFGKNSWAGQGNGRRQVCYLDESRGTEVHRKWEGRWKDALSVHHARYREEVYGAQSC
jgi:hypothetical protein